MCPAAARVLSDRDRQGVEARAELQALQAPPVADAPARVGRSRDQLASSPMPPAPILPLAINVPSRN
eukprot:8683432-Alexandrium_andersonii.AAC.1